MASPLEVDLLVVGLGPAGASAARTAAEGGLTVLAVDRRKELGRPVQCAELLPNPMLRHGTQPGVLVQKVAGMRTFLPSGHEEHTDFPALMIDRANLDRGLAEQAETAGARVTAATRLMAFDAEAGWACLRGAEGEYEVRFRAAVGADGPHSMVARSLGLPQQKTVHTRQHTLPLRTDYADTDIYLAPDFPGGYGWLFPKGEVANVGLGIDRRFADDLGGPLEGLIAHLEQRGLVENRVLARTGGSIPVGGLRPMVHPGPVLLAGDAAGLTHPITGAGIPAALIAGERAGEAMVDYLGGEAEALADYAEDIADQFAVSLNRGVARREELEGIWNRPEAATDPPHRRGWIAFSDYFRTETESPVGSAL